MSLSTDCRVASLIAFAEARAMGTATNAGGGATTGAADCGRDEDGKFGAGNTCRVGININDSHQDFTGQILAGAKTSETRITNSLKPYVGKTVGIVRTGKGKATLVGTMKIGEPKFYKTAKEFDADFDKHRIAKGSPHYIGPDGKYGYPLSEVKKVKPVTLDTKGIIARVVHKSERDMTVEYDLSGESPEHPRKTKEARTESGDCGRDEGGRFGSGNKCQTVYHGTDADDPHSLDFKEVSQSTNFYGLLGNVDVTRHGIFFSDSKDFSSEYGKNVGEFSLKAKKVADLTPGPDYHSDVVREFIDALHDSGKDRDVMVTAYHSNKHKPWLLFDNEVGEKFTSFLKSKGYDAAKFPEYTESADGQEKSGTTFVVLDKSKIKPKKSSRAFCPTGDGGGVNNTCSSSNGGSHSMPKGKAGDPKSDQSWLSPSGDFHPVDRNDPHKSWVTHHDWAVKNGVKGGEKELMSKGWMRVVRISNSIYASSDIGKQLTAKQAKSLTDHAILSGHDEAVYENEQGRESSVWRKNERAFCPTGTGGGVDNSCGKSSDPADGGSGAGLDRVWSNSPLSRGETVGQWLDRHKIKKEGDKYVFYHARPSGSGYETLRKGSYLADDPRDAAFQAARDRELNPDTDVEVIKVLLRPDEINPGVHPTLRKPYAIGRERDARAFCPTGTGGGVDNSCGKSSDPADGERLKSAAVRWKGNPSDLVIHIQDELAGAPAPPSGSGKKMREEAASLLRELKENSEPAPMLYRGDNKESPSPVVGWTANKKVADHWAKVHGGKVYTLEGASGLSLKKIVGDAFDDGEDEWLVLNDKRRSSSRAFCPTGDGGGVDNSCGSDAAGNHQPTKPKWMGPTDASGSTKHGTWFLEQNTKQHESPGHGDVTTHVISLIGDGDKVKAFVHADLSDDKANLYVNYAHVAEPYRRQGVYTSLLDSLSDQFRVTSDEQHNVDSYAKKAYESLGAEVDRYGHYILEKKRKGDRRAFCPTGEQGGVDNSCSAYQGTHKPPSESSGAPAHDLTRLLPDDVYSKDAGRLYGHGDRQLDEKTASIIRGLKGNPESTVNIYRAVPKSAGGNINGGDWVTVNKDYAEQHGESTLQGDYKIVSKAVKAKEIFNNGDSIHEWGYRPSKRSIDARYASLLAFAEARDCGRDDSGQFSTGNTCASGAAADAAKGAAKGAVEGALVGAYISGPAGIKPGAAVGAAVGAVKGIYDNQTRPTRVKRVIEKVGLDEEKVGLLVKSLGGSPRSSANAKRGTLSLKIRDENGKKTFHVDIDKKSVTVYPVRKSSELTAKEIKNVKDIAKSVYPRPVSVEVKKTSSAYVAKLVKNGFKVTAGKVAGTLVANYVVPTATGASVEVLEKIKPGLGLFVFDAASDAISSVANFGKKRK